ncbi:hypothetical protein [Rathayibacter sp. AY1A3]|uniref:hypothetical protein n=1 Tax=Rathayibacter sp. AY1A3 TaxID=2080521 RepID=UPI000CE8D47F|nr:hypothetical protein [Rathayibacter sp. AY1A3]PPF34401.1 hypothetical protein C5C10_09370 [Rathayibacter sp. AY1A3]
MPRRPDLAVKAELLRRAYASNHNSHVAFIDESYLAPSRGEPQTPFYIATAYIAPCEDHADIRADLLALVGGNFWHTTEAHRSEEGRLTVAQLCDYIAEGGNSEHIVVAIKKPILPSDPDGEVARAQCLTDLLAALHSGTFAPAVSLILFEERKFQTQMNADVRTISAARAAGLIGRNTTVFQASPSYETILWLPDVVSFAAYQRHIGSDADYLSTFEERVQYLTVSDPTA